MSITLIEDHIGCHLVQHITVAKPLLRAHTIAGGSMEWNLVASALACFFWRSCKVEAGVLRAH